MTNEDASRRGDGASSSMEEKARRDARSAAQTVKADLESAGDEVQRQAGAAVEAVKHELDAASHEAEGMANSQKDMMARKLGGVAGAVRKAADELDRENTAGAQLTRDLADRIGQLSTTLKEHEMGDLIGMAEQFGRRQPMVFLGTSAAAGFIASRFLRASSHHHNGAASPRSNGGQS